MKKFVKISAIAFLFFILALGVGVYFLSHPPEEAKLIHKFNENRAAFEQLREMLQADPNLSRHGQYSPPEKIEKYQSLLKVVGNPIAYASGKGTNADLSFMVWGWGFAGEAEHLDICWLHERPTNQIATMDGYQGQSDFANRVCVFKHIDQQWYLSVDW